MPSAKLKKYVLLEPTGYSGCGNWDWELPTLDDVISKLDEIEKEQATASDSPEASAEARKAAYAAADTEAERWRNYVHVNAIDVASIEDRLTATFGPGWVQFSADEDLVKVANLVVERWQQFAAKLRSMRNVAATYDAASAEARKAAYAADEDDAADARRVANTKPDRFAFPSDGSIPDFLRREKSSGTLPTSTADREETLAKNPEAKPFWRAA
jgi:hypothetical protein